MNPSNSLKVYGLTAHFKFPILVFFFFSLKGNIFETLSIHYGKISMPGLKKENERNMRCCLSLKYWSEVCMLEAGFLFHELLLLLHCSISYFQRT